MKITIPLSYDSANYPYNDPAAELELSETDSGECIRLLGEAREGSDCRHELQADGLRHSLTAPDTRRAAAGLECPRTEERCRAARRC